MKQKKNNNLEIVGAIKDISKNMMVSRMDDEDFTSCCIDYVKERYVDDYGERKRVRKIVEENEKSFIRLWRVIMKRNLTEQEIDRKFDNEIADLE